MFFCLGKWTDSDIASFYAPRTLKALHITCLLIHPFTQALLLCLHAFHLLITHIHTLMESSKSNLGFVSCPRICGIQTGTAKDGTINLPISRWSAILTELQEQFIKLNYQEGSLYTTKATKLKIIPAKCKTTRIKLPGTSSDVNKKICRNRCFSIIIYSKSRKQELQLYWKKVTFRLWCS